MKLACLAALLTLAACSAPPLAEPTSRPTSRRTDGGLERVASIHGGLGPWAVAGYRMGLHALAELGRQRGDFALAVEHRSPAEVQWSCILDGLQAATGTSPGKLNLSWERVDDPDALESRVRDREQGTSLVFHLREEFRQRYLGVPPEGLDAAGREVAELPAAEIFEVQREQD